MLSKHVLCVLRVNDLLRTQLYVVAKPTNCTDIRQQRDIRLNYISLLLYINRAEKAFQLNFAGLN